MGNHGFSWLALALGSKLWHLAPGEAPKPRDPDCTLRPTVDAGSGSVHCVQRHADVLIVPTTWWHATCTLSEYAIGIGGQDSCDLLECGERGAPVEVGGRSVFCADTSKAEACHGRHGVEAANRLEERQSKELAREEQDEERGGPWRPSRLADGEESRTE